MKRGSTAPHFPFLLGEAGGHVPPRTTSLALGAQRPWHDGGCRAPGLRARHCGFSLRAAVQNQSFDFLLIRFAGVVKR